MSTNAVAAPKKEQKEYVMPKPEVSDMVMYWYRSDDDTRYPAVVLEVGDGSLTLAVMSPRATYYDPIYGVKHYTDGSRKDLDDRGVWDFTPQTKRFREFLAEFEELKRQLGGMKR